MMAHSDPAGPGAHHQARLPAAAWLAQLLHFQEAEFRALQEAAFADGCTPLPLQDLSRLHGVVLLAAAEKTTALQQFGIVLDSVHNQVVLTRSATSQSSGACLLWAQFAAGLAPRPINFTFYSRSIPSLHKRTFTCAAPEAALVQAGAGGNYDLLECLIQVLGGRACKEAWRASGSPGGCSVCSSGSGHTLSTSMTISQVAGPGGVRAWSVSCHSPRIVCERHPCLAVAEVRSERRLSQAPAGALRFPHHYTCSSCGAHRHLHPMPTCQGCHWASYCSKSCQESDWPAHRPCCRAIQAQGSLRDGRHLRKSFAIPDPQGSRFL